MERCYGMNERGLLIFFLFFPFRVELGSGKELVYFCLLLSRWCFAGIFLFHFIACFVEVVDFTGARGGSRWKNRERLSVTKVGNGVGAVT